MLPDLTESPHLSWTVNVILGEAIVFHFSPVWLGEVEESYKPKLTKRLRVLSLWQVLGKIRGRYDAEKGEWILGNTGRGVPYSSPVSVSTLGRGLHRFL